MGGSVNHKRPRGWQMWPPAIPHHDDQTAVPSSSPSSSQSSPWPAPSFHRIAPSQEKEEEQEDNGGGSDQDGMQLTDDDHDDDDDVMMMHTRRSPKRMRRTAEALSSSSWSSSLPPWRGRLPPQTGATSDGPAACGPRRDRGASTAGGDPPPDAGPQGWRPFSPGSVSVGSSIGSPPPLAAASTARNAAAAAEWWKRPPRRASPCGTVPSPAAPKSVGATSHHHDDDDVDDDFSVMDTDASHDGAVASPWADPMGTTDDGRCVPSSHHLAQCHICRTSFPPPILPQVRDVMPRDALLNYFSPVSGRAAMMTTTMSATGCSLDGGSAADDDRRSRRPDVDDPSRCSCCDRTHCPGCSHSCVACRQVVCTFCSVARAYRDGSGDAAAMREGTFCLDCSVALEQC